VKYTVEFKVSYVANIDVEADSDGGAVTKARQFLGSDYERRTNYRADAVDLRRKPEIRGQE